MTPRAHSTALARLLAAAALGAMPALAQDPRPDLVLFVADDLGWADTSVAMDGEAGPANRRYRTPNLERLAARGVRLASAYAAAPVCTPSRVAILTGQSPARTRITSWVLHAGQDTSSAHPALLAPAWQVDGLQPGTKTLPALLRDRGYRTIHVGKAHFGAVGTPGADPRQLGFDINIAGHGAGAPGSYRGTERFAQRSDAKSVWDVPGLERWHGKEVHLDEALAEEAVAELQRAHADGVPFFLSFAPYGVHVPITANPRYLAHYQDRAPVEAAYATMVETVDAALGRILDTLDALGRGERAVVVFTSDNGGLSAHSRGGAPHTHNAPLRSGKGSAYEGGIRVPAIVAWPGVVTPGSTCAEPIIGHDWLPTLLAAAGIPVPAALDGRDLTPALRGERAPPRTLLWHFPHFWGVSGPGIAPFTAVRQGSWKAIWWHAERRFELHDLDADPSEERDLALQRPEVVAALAEEMARAMASSRAQPSLDKETGKPIPGPLAGLTPRFFDLSTDSTRQVVVDREAGRYLGHVTTVLLEDCKTLLAAYPEGHGKGPIVLKRSQDGGLTWSSRLRLPGSFATSLETPTIHRVVDASGTRRLCLWSGLHPARIAHSADDGATWSELAPAGDFGGIVVMASVVPLTQPGHYLGLFHDDGRYFSPSTRPGGTFTLYSTRSRDGGLGWSPPQAIFAARDLALCEPGCIRSPDGKRLALLLREETRARRSHLMLSDDDGATWNEPRELPFALTGDRHVGKLSPDGRLVVVLRDRTIRGAFHGEDVSTLGRGSPTEGDFVAWVGTFDDLLQGRPGQYRVRLLDNKSGWDCGYAGLEVLPDATLVATTYGHWEAGAPPYILSVRFRLAELDALAAR